MTLEHRPSRRHSTSIPRPRHGCRHPRAAAAEQQDLPKQNSSIVASCCWASQNAGRVLARAAGNVLPSPGLKMIG